MIKVEELMKRDVHSIHMDTLLGEAMELCSDRKIRHLPVLDDNEELVGLITDRDLRYYISPRIGTLSENSADRETLMRRVHLVMVRNVIATSPDTPLKEAARLMRDHRVGCLPVIDADRRVVGLLTTSDILRYIADGE